MAFGVLLLPLGVALVALTERQRLRGRQRAFLLLTGIAGACISVFVVLHNAVYGLAIYLFGPEFWQRTGIEDEPVFFILALVVCPIAVLVGAVGALVLALRR